MAQPLKVDFKQFANDPTETWINSILQENNSTYYEGSSTLQRIVFFNIGATQGHEHVLTLSHQATKGTTVHAYDFITGYDQALLDYAQIAGVPFSNLDIAGTNLGPGLTAANLHRLFNNNANTANKALASVPAAAGYHPNAPALSPPDDPSLVVTNYDLAKGAQSRAVQLYGNKGITNAQLILTGYSSSGQDVYAEYELRWTSQSDSLLILFAGHLSRGGAVNEPLGYGPGKGASNINGGPYHVKLAQLDGASLGSQDNQIKAADILLPPCDISGPPTVCPGSTNSYTTATTGVTYSWTISGNGTILGSATSQTVTVQAGNACNQNYTLMLSLSGGISECSLEVNVQDTQAPDITQPGADATIQCPAAPSFTPPTASDNCSTPTLSHTDDFVPGACAGTGIHTRTWYATDACGNMSGTVSQSITVIDNVAPIISPPGQDMTVQCPASANDLPFTPPTGGDACNGQVNISSSDQTIPGPCAGTYIQIRTWNATDACGNAAPPVSQAITVIDNIAPQIGQPGADATIKCPDSPQFTPPTATDLCDQNPAIIELPPIIADGFCLEGNLLYAITHRWIAVDACGNASDEVSQTITVVDTTPPQITCAADATVACDGNVEFTPPTATDGCDPEPTIVPGTMTSVQNNDGSTTYTMSWTAIDACGNESAACMQNITQAACEDAHCTLTQGYYGNSGGLYCTGETTLQLITRLLAADLVLGGGGNMLTLTQADAGCLIGRMPSGGPSVKLNGIASCTTPTGITIKKGKFANTLLGQAITLGLNLRLDTDLGAVVIDNPLLVTIAITDCGDLTSPVIPGTEQMFNVPSSVINYLGGAPTVQQIFDLANLALAGSYVPGAGQPSLADITAAMGAINDGFDECRVKTTLPVQTTRLAAPALSQELQLAAFPNPFLNTTTLTVSSQKASQIQVQVFDMEGRLVKDVFSGNAEAGAVYNFTVDAAHLPQGMYFTRLMGAGQVHYLKLMVVR